MEQSTQERAQSKEEKIVKDQFIFVEMISAIARGNLKLASRSQSGILRAAQRLS